MKKKKPCGAIALLLCLFLCIPAAADFSIAIPDDPERGGDEMETPFPDPVYKAIDFGDFVTATKNLISMYESIDSPVGGEYASARLIVSAKEALPDLSGYHVAQTLVDSSYNYLIQFTNPEDAEACHAYLKTLSYVNFSEPDREMTLPEPEKGGAMEATDVDAQYNSWGVEATKIGEYANYLKSKGANATVKVAVVDSGVDNTHPFLSGRVTSGYDLVDDDATPQDGNGHGTHVSGTVVDCTPGLNNIQILPVRVMDNNGRGQDSVIGLGIQYAVDHGANVINMSLGGFGHSQYIDSKIDYAVSKNVVVVVAAGNSNQDTQYYCPAGDTKCITVAAVEKSKSKASFSNYGDAVDIAAPGKDIKSCVPGGGYESWAGTSMASPHVAAAAALLLCDNSSQTPAQIEKKLRDAAEDLGSTGWDRYYGAGFLNMAPFIGDTGFTDVPPDAYYHDAVMWAVKEKITNGTTPTTFSPNNTCTTKQILTFMWRADGSPQPQSLSVASSDFGKALAWASDTEISTSVGADTEEGCTRASAMTYMWTHAGKPAAGNNPFSDVPNNTYYAQAVCWAVHKGITNGTTATTFSPNNLCTRAQIMTFLYRYYVKAINS